MELQWKEHNESEQQQSSAYLNNDCYYQSTELPLFTSESSSTKLNLSSFHSTAPSSRMGGSSYFSPAQWQELELQALIFRHMIAGAPVPPQLLHLVKKSLILNSPYYHSSPYHTALLHSGSGGGGGYWGRGGMDPEPGRCRRTDGKKWRCSRDVVGGHKYCERHMHRGRNRSRKPVETPTPNSNTPAATATATATALITNNNNNNNNAGFFIHTNTSSQSISSAHPQTATTFGFSGPSHSFDLLHLNQRPSETLRDAKGLYRTPKNELPEDGSSTGGQVLRHFFDDLPVQGSEYNLNNAGPGTSLSISVPGNQSSDISLKLSTGGDNGDNHPGYDGNVGREQHLLQWGSSATSWGTNQMGGPLAEALRSSSTSTSSPTSVLQQLRGATNFIST